MLRRHLIVGLGALAATGAIAPSPVLAAWPEHEITIIVPVSPGSSADQTARVVAEVMSRELDTTVVVKNVVGGGGLTGFAEVAKSEPDGYTMGIINNGALLIMPHVMANVPVTMADYDFVGGVAAVYYGLAVSADSPIKTLDDLVKAGKERRVTFAANTPMNAVAMIQLGNLTGGHYQLVMTQSQPEAVAQAAGGHVDAVVQTPSEMIPLIDGGQLTFLASASPKRWPKYPDVPTLQEAGYDAANVVPLGFAVPHGVPADRLAKLRAAVATAATDPKVVETLERLTIISQPLSAEELEAALKRNAPIVEATIEAAGMKKK